MKANLIRDIEECISQSKRSLGSDLNCSRRTRIGLDLIRAFGEQLYFLLIASAGVFDIDPIEPDNESRGLTFLPYFFYRFNATVFQYGL